MKNKLIICLRLFSVGLICAFYLFKNPRIFSRNKRFIYIIRGTWAYLLFRSVTALFVKGLTRYKNNYAAGLLCLFIAAAFILLEAFACKTDIYTFLRGFIITGNLMSGAEYLRLRLKEKRA